jgi:drug/metabolite transporter (DMT)-like permease
MGVLLGLLTALAWGSSDFLARFPARRIGSLRTTLYMQLTGLVLLTIFLPWIGGWGHLFDGSGWRPWAWGALAGIVNGIATLALYRSFELGKMAVVAPISAGYPVLTVTLSLFSGERLTILRAAGIAAVILGVVLVARGEVPAGGGSDVASLPAPENPSRGNGVGWAFLSGIGFGLLFWLLGTRVVPVVGFASTVWMIRFSSCILSSSLLLAFRQSFSLPRQGSISMLLLAMGVLDTGAFVLNNRGLELEQISAVSVLASLYCAVSIILAAIFLREHLLRWQWLGIVAILAGIGLISR